MHLRLNSRRRKLAICCSAINGVTYSGRNSTRMARCESAFTAASRPRSLDTRSGTSNGSTGTLTVSRAAWSSAMQRCNMGFPAEATATMTCAALATKRIILSNPEAQGKLSFHVIMSMICSSKLLLVIRRAREDEFIGPAAARRALRTGSRQPTISVYRQSQSGMP